MDASNVVSDFALACVSATIGKTTVAPLERVKLLLQLQDASTQITQHTRYSGMRNCFQRVYREQGLRSFWRGNLANVLRYFPTQAMSLTLKDLFRRHTQQYDPNTQFRQFMLVNMLAGGAAGFCTTVVVYPLDFARTRLAVDVGVSTHEKQFLGLQHVLQKVWTEEGLIGFYRGISISLPGIVFYRSMYFGLFDTFKVMLPTEAGVLAKFLLAQTITTACGLIVYPTDTVRRRMMMQASRKDVLYRGIADCAQQIYQEGGVRSFYKGAFTNILRSSGGAMVLVLYDTAKQVLFPPKA